MRNIEKIEKLTEEDYKIDLFKEFIKTYDRFLRKIEGLSKSWYLSTTKENELREVGEGKKILGNAFGKNALKIFYKSLPLTGFGSAIGKLKSYNLVKNFAEVSEQIDKLNESSKKMEEFFISLLIKLDEIRNISKKIGNDQRLFFHYFFRELFNREGDAYLNLNGSVEIGYRKFFSQLY